MDINLEDCELIYVQEHYFMAQSAPFDMLDTKVSLLCTSHFMGNMTCICKQHKTEKWKHCFVLAWTW